MTLSQLTPYLNDAAAAFSLIAGGLWLVSATRSTPSDFTKVEIAIAEGGLTDEMGAIGPQYVYLNTKPLIDLANAIKAPEPIQRCRGYLRLLGRNLSGGSPISWSLLKLHFFG